MKFDLSRKLEDKLYIGPDVYGLDLSFDNVLKIFELWEDDEIPSHIKPHVALKMLSSEAFEEHFKEMPIEEVYEIFEEIFDEHINLNPSSIKDVEYDLAGNVMTTSPTGSSEQKFFNARFDGEYIFASFMQAYGINLFKVQGELHWKEFNALLAGLPEGTKLSEVIQARKYKPQKGDTEEYKREMLKRKKEYALPNQKIEDEEEESWEGG
ncbi:Gp15 family bacteriophage protein [Streptococcus sp. 10F2]